MREPLQLVVGKNLVSIAIIFIPLWLDCWPVLNGKDGLARFFIKNDDIEPVIFNLPIQGLRLLDSPH
jgi:hypothetical protein